MEEEEEEEKGPTTHPTPPLPSPNTTAFIPSTD